MTRSNKNNKNNLPREKIVRKKTAGGLVFAYLDEKLHILLVQDLKKRWSVPKGSLEKKETNLMAAKREIAEETGITAIHLISKLGELRYFYRHQNAIQVQTLTLFIFRQLDISEQIVPENSNSIINVEWVEYTEALKRIEYPDLVKLIESKKDVYTR